MDNLKLVFRLFLLLLVAVMAAGCGPGEQSVQPPSDGEKMEEVQTGGGICDLSASQIGNTVDLQGKIQFIDDSDPMGIFLELVKDGCRVGVFIDSGVFNSWDEDRQGMFVVGNSVDISGVLNQYQGELTVDVIGLEMVAEPGPESSGENIPSAEESPAEMSGSDLPANVRLDVPVVYSGYEGEVGLCYLGAFASAALYHHPEMTFSDLIAYSGAGSGAYNFDQMMDVPPFLTNPFWDGTMVNVANAIDSKFGVGYAAFGSDSDPFNPNQIRFVDHAEEVNLFESSDEALHHLKYVVANGSPVVVFLNTGPVSVDFADVSDFWSVRSGDQGGHYMTVTGYDEEYIYLNDPTEPEGNAKDLPTMTEHFLKAWEETLIPEVGASGPYWMFYFIEAGYKPDAADILNWNHQIGMSAPDQIRAFTEKPGADDFSCFSYRELARSRLEFASYLESNGFSEIAVLYREAGDIYGEMGMSPQNLQEQLNVIADLEEEALNLMANPK